MTPPAPRRDLLRRRRYVRRRAGTRGARRRPAGAARYPVTVLVVCGCVAGVAVWTVGTVTAPTVTYAVPGADLAAARTALTTLEVKGRAPLTGYDRTLFGPAWVDVDGNGCDTRNDVLARDLAEVVLDTAEGACTVLAGELVDPYGGQRLAFARGEDSSAVQIDHVVALADAWQKGAWRWTDAARQEFANDPLNLLAVDGALNQEKGAGDAATWLPPNTGVRCAYAVRQILVKDRWDLSVTQAEHDALDRELGRCVTVDE